MRACGQKLVKFCTLTHTLTHTRGKISSRDRVLPAAHAYRFLLRYQAINDIAHLKSYRDAIGAPCIRAQKNDTNKI